MQYAFKKLVPRLKRCLNQRVRFESTFNFEVREHITNAIANKIPVVALESTIITHGTPFPENLRIALSVENILQKKGVMPATIGIIDGKLIVGLNDKEMEYLAQRTDDSIKTSRRDLSYVLSTRKNGGTTVSATMLAAKLAKIPIFVTGGIGGVHRGAEKSFDVSADLVELGKTPVAVVCAGVKSILDIPLTLEYLETQGVPVINYSDSTDFPSFFSSTSGYNAPYCMDDPQKVASLIYHQNNYLDLQTGTVIAVPIPSEYSFDREEIEAVIKKALEEAGEKNINGKAITPFVLKKVSDISHGKSLEANIKLIENNASVGADIAVEYAKLLQESTPSNKTHSNLSSSDNSVAAKKRKKKKSHLSNLQNVTHSIKKRPVVIGSAILDIKTTSQEISDVAENTNPGSIDIVLGGVGRNISEYLARCEMDPLFITKLGRDFQGDIIHNEMKRLNMDTSGIYWSRVYKTGTYNLVTSHDTGEIQLAVGDMQINESISTTLISSWESEMRNASIVVIDANLPKENIHLTLEMCQKHKVPVWYEPTCFSKSAKPFFGGTLPIFEFASPNFVELNAMSHTLKGGKLSDLKVDENLSSSEKLKKVIELSKDFRGKIPNLLVTLGKDGLLLISSRRVQFGEGDNKTIAYLHYPAVPKHASLNVINVSGAGDSLAGGIIYGFLNEYDKDTCVKAGLLSAYKSLHSKTTISEDINPSLLAYDAVQSWANYAPKSLFDVS